MTATNCPIAEADLFARPFPVASQVFFAGPLAPALSPVGGCGAFPDIFVRPTVPPEFLGAVLRPISAATNTTTKGWYYQLDYRFAKGFPAAEQQFQTFGRYITSPQIGTTAGGSSSTAGGRTLYIKIVPPPSFVPKPVTVSNTKVSGQSPQHDVLFCPFPAAEQQFAPDVLAPLYFTVGGGGAWPDIVYWPTLIVDSPFEPQGNIPTPKTPHGWEGYQLDYLFGRPFPATEQVFNGTPQPRGNIPTPKTPHGWEGYQLDYLFGLPFPTTEQVFEGALQPQGNIPTPKTPHGWEGLQYEPPPSLFANPFAAAQQQYSAGRLSTPPLPPPPPIPPPPPPGAGKKRPPLPSYYPQPAYQEEARKPVKPIWDRGGKVEIKDLAPAQPVGPPPMPPASLFAPRVTAAPLNLPTFNNLMPGNPGAMAQHLEQVAYQSNLAAALKSLGIIKDE